MSARPESVNDPVSGNQKLSLGQIVTHLREHNQIKGLARGFARKLHDLKLNLRLIRATDSGAPLCDGRYVDRQQSVTTVGQHPSEHANGPADLKSVAVAFQRQGRKRSEVLLS